MEVPTGVPGQISGLLLFYAGQFLTDRGRRYKTHEIRVTTPMLLIIIARAYIRT